MVSSDSAIVMLRRYGPACRVVARSVEGVDRSARRKGWINRHFDNKPWRAELARARDLRCFVRGPALRLAIASTCLFEVIWGAFSHQETWHQRDLFWP